MGDVVYPEKLTTTLPIPADKVVRAALGAAERGELVDVVVIGTLRAGGLYLASSLSSAAEAVMLVEMFKRDLVERARDLAEEGGP